jgi:hypothetical protein
MSPEQARGDRVDHRIDVYAMGCMLFQLVTGRVPFEADNFMGVLTMHLTEPPPQIPDTIFDLIGAPRELAGVIAQAMAKDRAQRYQTIDAFANAVRAVCGEAPIEARSSGRMPAFRAPSVPAPAETMRRTPPAGSAVIPDPTPPAASGAIPAASNAPPAASGAIPAVSNVTPPTGAAAISEPASGSGAVPASEVAASASGSAPAAPAAGDSAALAASASAARSRTWTGLPSVPQADEPSKQKRRSKVPLAVGALVLAGGAVAAVFALQGRRGPADPSLSDPGSGSASGAPLVAVIDAAVPDAAVAVTPPPPPPPPEPPLPVKVMVTLSSKPRGAIVKDLTTGAVFGKTPRKFSVTPGRMPRQYLLTLRGYADAQIELVPDRESIEHTEELVKGISGRPTVARPITRVKPPEPTPTPTPTPPDPGPTTKPPDPIPTPTPPPPDAALAPKPPDPTPTPTPTPTTKPPDEDCPEQPCLKSDPSRRGGGGGSSAP